MENNNKTQIVTIEKWYHDLRTNKYWYWIVGEDGIGIDGFRKKYQAINAIERWGMFRKNKTIKVKS
jgi:hypothetical protein